MCAEIIFYNFFFFKSVNHFSTRDLFRQLVSIRPSTVWNLAIETLLLRYITWAFKNKWFFLEGDQLEIWILYKDNDYLVSVTFDHEVYKVNLITSCIWRSASLIFKYPKSKVFGSFYLTRFFQLNISTIYKAIILIFQWVFLWYL